MFSKKLRNTITSLILFALWASFILIVSADRNQNTISSIYFWIMASILVTGFGGLLLLALRLFKVINGDNNFLYLFFGVGNTLTGLLGIYFYLLGKINMVGLHDTLPDLIIGIVIMADVFLFENIFKEK